MPPKKNSLPLSGCTVATSGTFAGTTQAAVHSTITALGGNVAKSITQDTRILVSTPADVKKASKKVQDAQSNDIPVVCIDWLDDCSTQGDFVDPDLHLLTSAAPPTSHCKGKKRAASPSIAPSPKAAKVGEGSVLKSRDVLIPIDEGCPLQTYRVYVDEDGIVHDGLLNQTNAGNNNNKFYRIQLLWDPRTGDYKTWTRWGRVGARGQSKVLGSGSLDDAIKQWDLKFKDKSGLTWAERGANPKKGRYAYVERSYEADCEEEVEEVAANSYGRESRSVSPAKSTLSVPVQNLMRLIFNQDYMNEAMTALHYDAEKMPLGKLSKATINRGFQTLKDLAGAINAAASYSDTDVEDLSNMYYSLIPHNFGRSHPPVIRDVATVKRELDLLDSLGDMKEAADLMKKDLAGSQKINALDRQFQGLGLNEMSVLDPRETEFQELSLYLNNTRGATHAVNYQVESIFRIERNGESDRFNKSPFAKIKSDRRLLWHGSRATNFGGILRQGLRIAPPEAPVSGYMFGKGVYLADMSSKSANYCCAYNSGGHALLLLCEAELGQPMYELADASSNAGQEAYQNGSYSTWGKGMTGPLKWKDAGGVHTSLAGVKMPDTRYAPTDTNIPGTYLLYNEYIAYDIAQVQLRYLFRVRM